MASFIHNLCYLTFQRSLHFLLRWTTWESALVVTPWILAPFNLFLSVFSPVVTILSFPLLLYIVRSSLIVWTTLGLVPLVCLVLPLLFLKYKHLNLRKTTWKKKEDWDVEEHTCDWETELFVVVDVVVGAETTTPGDCVWNEKSKKLMLLLFFFSSSFILFWLGSFVMRAPVVGEARTCKTIENIIITIIYK